MKFHLLFLVATGTILLLGGCKHRNDTPTDAVATADSSQIDTTITDNDSIVEEQDTIAPPKKADEFFDDFAFAFMENRRFQRSRISFPLPYTIDGQTNTLPAMLGSLIECMLHTKSTHSFLIATKGQRWRKTRL